MRPIVPVLTVFALLASSATAIAQILAPQPWDVSHEYGGETADPNGLPPASNAVPGVILDGKAYTYPGAGAADPSLRWGVPVNEWVVPLVYSDGSTGMRTKSFLFPGATRFHALYGAYQDRDGDKIVEMTSDAANEWTGITTGRMLGFVSPGHHPAATGDYYLLAKFIVQDPSENSTDFLMAHRENGQWTGEDIIPFFGASAEIDGLYTPQDDSLIEETTVAIVANGTETPGTAPGYTCAGPTSGPDCRIDVDRYDVLSPEVVLLYETTIDTLREVDEIVSPLIPDIESEDVDQAITLLVDLTLYGFNQGFNSTFGAAVQESALPAAYFGLGANRVCTSSMTFECGATRYLPSSTTVNPNGYNYQDAFHGFANIIARSSYSGLTVTAIGVPDPDDNLDARGLTPLILRLTASIGFWQDLTRDGWVGNMSGVSSPFDNYLSPEDEWDGTCGVRNTNTGQRVDAINVTLSPLADDGSPGTWGPSGAYLLKAETPFPGVGDDPGGILDLSGIGYDDAVTDVLADGQVNRFYTGSSPIRVTMSCDTTDEASGDWFMNEEVLLASGTRGFNLKVAMDPEFAVEFDDGSGRVEGILDIDVYPRWD